MQLSAFVDGELPENEKELLLRRLSQDGGLRQQVAEYLAIGHALRGEVQISGVSTLRDRVAGALDDRPMHDEPVSVDAGQPGLARPFAGAAIVATVALAGIFGLRQFAEPVLPGDSAAAELAELAELADVAEFPTQPQADDILRQYRLLHDSQTSYLGSNSINTRLTAFELRRTSGAAGAQRAPAGDDAEPDDGQNEPKATE